jgi:hypothetical protein
MNSVFDFLVACGLIATRQRELVPTALEMKNAARKLDPTNSLGVIHQVVAVSGMAAFGCLYLGLFHSHSTTTSISSNGAIDAFWIAVWSGLLSAGFGFFAATARAAVLARSM